MVARIDSWLPRTYGSITPDLARWINKVPNAWSGQALNDYIVAPRFLDDRFGLAAVWIIFALFAGPETFGFLDTPLAVPVTATLGVLTRFWLERYLQSLLYLDHQDIIFDRRSDD